MMSLPRLLLRLFLLLQLLLVDVVVVVDASAFVVDVVVAFVVFVVYKTN